MRKATVVLFLLAACFLTLLGNARRAGAQTDATVQDIQTGSVADTAAYRLRGVIVTAIYNDQVGAPTSNGFWVQDRPSGGNGAEGDLCDRLGRHHPGDRHPAGHLHRVSRALTEPKGMR